MNFTKANLFHVLVAHFQDRVTRIFCYEFGHVPRVLEPWIAS